MKFTPEEEAVMRDQEFFLNKNSVTKKIKELFAELEGEMKKEILNFNLSYNVPDYSGGRIFSGENYKMYPYILLDYPRHFSATSVFAFRTMFWWGHEFSLTLHLQGEALNHYREIIYNSFDTLHGKQIFYCVNNTPWQYTFEKENYLPVEEVLNRKEELHTVPFIKLSRKIPVQSYERLMDFSMETFKIFMKILDRSENVKNR